MTRTLKKLDYRIKTDAKVEKIRKGAVFYKKLLNNK